MLKLPPNFNELKKEMTELISKNLDVDGEMEALCNPCDIFDFIDQLKRGGKISPENASATLFDFSSFLWFENVGMQCPSDTELLCWNKSLKYQMKENFDRYTVFAQGDRIRDALQNTTCKTTAPRKI